MLVSLSGILCSPDLQLHSFFGRHELHSCHTKRVPVALPNIIPRGRHKKNTTARSRAQEPPSLSTAYRPSRFATTPDLVMACQISGRVKYRTQFWRQIKQSSLHVISLDIQNNFETQLLQTTSGRQSGGLAHKITTLSEACILILGVLRNIKYTLLTHGHVNLVVPNPRRPLQFATVS